MSAPVIQDGNGDADIPLCSERALLQQCRSGKAFIAHTGQPGHYYRSMQSVRREGDRYMKAGVMLADFTPSGIAQPGLFDEIQPHKNSEKLMKTLDELNQSGKGKECMELKRSLYIDLCNRIIYRVYMSGYSRPSENPWMPPKAHQM